MARMSIDDSIGRDTRLDHLALLCGWTKRETLGCLQLDIWPLAYDRVTPNIPPHDIEIAASRLAVAPVKHQGGFVGALIESRMARMAVKTDRQYEYKTRAGITIVSWPDQEIRDRVHLHGAAERIAYIIKKRESAHAGGVKSGESRGLGSKHVLKHTSTGAQAHAKHGAAAWNPSASVSPTASLNKEEGDADAPPVSSLADVKRKTDEAVADKADKIPERAWKAADYLRALVVQEDPNAAVARTPWGDHVRSGVRLGWADDIRLMVERDKRTYEQIAEVLQFLFKEQTGEAKFIVQSTDSLRKKWDRIQAVRRNNKPEKPAQKPLPIPLAGSDRR